MNNEYFPAVVQAVPGKGRSIYVYFSDGRITLFDTVPLIAKGGVFAKLEDDDFFVNALTVLNDTVAWDVSGVFDPTVCIDIDPFTLYQARQVSDPLETAA